MLSAIMHYKFYRGNMDDARRDERSAEVVVRAAAASIGESDAANPVIAALEKDSVKFAWQLNEAEREFWPQYGANGGLALAIKAELNHPTTPPKSDFTHVFTCHGEEVTDRLRHFLLIPGPDGQIPSSMGSYKAVFFAIVLTPPGDRQNLLLILCELLALVSGLLLAIPLSLVTPRVPEEKGWTLMPRLEDGMDAFAYFTFFLVLAVLWNIVYVAAATVAGGWKGSMDFFERGIGVVFIYFMILGVAVYFGVTTILVWQCFTAATSPYPLIGSLVLAQVGNNFVAIQAAHFTADAMPLEFYHWPQWIRQSVSGWGPGIKKKLSNPVLEAAARKRAAELCARAGIVVPPLVEPSDAANTTTSKEEGKGKRKAGQVVV